MSDMDEDEIRILYRLEGKVDEMGGNVDEIRTDLHRQRKAIDKKNEEQDVLLSEIDNRSRRNATYLGLITFGASTMVTAFATKLAGFKFW